MKSISGWIETDADKHHTCWSTFATCAAVWRVGWARRSRRWITGVRDEEKERYDRKSLALSPLPASPETCNTHPQHSGLSPPAWMRSPQFFCLCVCLRNFPPLFPTLPCPLFLFFSFAALIPSITHSVRASMWECISNIYFSLLSLPLSLWYNFTVSSHVYSYNLVFFVAVDTPTSLSFILLFFFIHWRYPSAFSLFM